MSIPGPIARWFRPPKVEQYEGAADIASEHKETVADLQAETVQNVLGECQRERNLLLSRSDQIDRKLLTVTTASGVYIALIVSRQASFAALVVWLVGALAIGSIFASYWAWRPIPFMNVPTDELIKGVGYSPTTMNWLLIAANSASIRHIRDLNAWKAEKLHWASSLLAVSAALTLVGAICGR